MTTCEISSVGRTSMHVLVKVYIEELSMQRKLINEACFVMVALDENEQPIQVPGLLPEDAGD